MTSKKGGKRKSVNLALQGGGSHGAFTWGVLDRILEDERLDLEAISGTSAGAMNAVVVADGLSVRARMVPAARSRISGRRSAKRLRPRQCAGG